jgi:hypothetical protein
MRHELPASDEQRAGSRGGVGGGVPAAAAAVATTPSGSGRTRRRGYLFRIAKADYAWPESGGVGGERVRALVAKLLVRDPQKRAAVDDVWRDDWMAGNAIDEDEGNGNLGDADGDGSKAAQLLGVAAGGDAAGGRLAGEDATVRTRRKGARGRPEWSEGEVWVGDITEVARGGA